MREDLRPDPGQLRRVAIAPFAELFEARYRYSGVSFSYAVGALLGGGFAPLIAAALQGATGTSLSVSAHMAAVGLLSLAAVIAMREPSDAR
ncbi:hypothetical protein [Nonomuraea sp. LPB2021202275-12-8]|uniref:hypothetical protein n=1 Tax=Nonomuraea sp. LPB2021202275-12-8 TaxID=3120159 RepID=UPI00300CCCE1